MRTFAALLLLGFLAVANAQVYTNYFGGKMSRSDQTGTTGFGRYDPARDEWFETAGVERIPGSAVVDVETHNSNNNLVYTITNTGTTSNVMLYDAENVAWTQMGETFFGSANDLLVDGNDMYLCGSFSGRVNSLAYRTVDAPSRTLWTNTHADGKTVPACSRVFAFPGGAEKRLVMLSSGLELMWKLPAGDWSSNASAIASNLRTATDGVVVSVLPTDCKVFDGFLYIYSQAGFLLTTDSASVHNWVRTSDGITFSRVLRLDPAHSVVSPGAWHPNVGGTVMYYLSELSVSAKNNYVEKGLFSAAIGSDLASIGARIGSYIDTSFGGARVYVLRSMADQVVVTFSSEVEFYRDPADYSYPIGFSNLDAFRHNFIINSPIVKIRADGANDWLPALGGGLAGAGAFFLRDNHDNTMIYAGGAITSVFNTYTRGVSAWDDETKRFVSIGNPLSDYPRISYFGITPSVRTMQVWKVGDSQAVVIGGTFARINNVTVNSLAYIRTSDVNDNVLISPWKALVQNDEAGATRRSDDSVLVNSANFIAGPGVVDNSIAIPSKNNGDSRRIFVTGTFSRAGDVDTSNVAAFEIDPVANTAEFLALQGGVNGAVFAIDAVGRKVFVGGNFQVAGNVSAQSIAMWDDDQSKWFALGTGVQGSVNAITYLGGNRLLVAGNFNNAGGVSVANVAVWDFGSEQWEAIPCERCSTTCESQYPESWFSSGDLCDALVTDVITNIERAGDKLLLAIPDGPVYLWYDERARIIRQWNPNNAMRPDMDEQVFARTFMPAPSGSKADTWAIVETNVDNDVSYFTEIDSKSGNTFKLHRGGFDDRVYTVSSANSLAFASMGMLVLIALIALLF